MWKDYLYLTKRERKSVWVMTVLVLVLQVGIWTSDLWLKPVARLLKPQTATPSQIQPLPDKSYSNASANRQGATVKPVLQAFNPNTADSTQLRAVGLKSKVVRNILKYRSKGGQFRKPDDLAKIYGLDAEVFNRLRPYIRLSETQGSKGAYSETGRNSRESESVKSILTTLPISTSPENLTLPVKNPLTGSVASSPSSLSVNSTTPTEPLSLRSIQPTAAGNQFELNEADTATLQLLKGVGSITASRIIKYRQQLGGFYDVRQLNEIKGLYPTVLETLTKTVSVNPEKISKININNVSLEKLKAHPYLDFYQAKVIVELRKNRKTIRSLSELSAFKEFTTADLERLKWYVEL